MKNALFFCLVSLALTACTGVYKIPIQQGNIVTQDKLDQLKTGMTKRQVEFLLGTPLIIDSFHQNRWTYLYSIHQGDKTPERYEVTVFFENERMSKYNLKGKLKKPSDFGKPSKT